MLVGDGDGGRSLGPGAWGHCALLSQGRGRMGAENFLCFCGTADGRTHAGGRTELSPCDDPSSLVEFSLMG